MGWMWAVQEAVYLALPRWLEMGHEDEKRGKGDLWAFDWVRCWWVHDPITGIDGEEESGEEKDEV